MQRRTRPLIRENKERQLRLSELARMIPWKPCQKTIYLWCTTDSKGCRGSIRLESVRTPGGLVTSWEAYERFLDALATKQE